MQCDIIFSSLLLLERIHCQSITLHFQAHIWTNYMKHKIDFSTIIDKYILKFVDQNVNFESYLAIAEYCTL